MLSSIQIIKRSQDTLDAAAETAIAKLTQENRGKPVTKAQEDEARLSILRESMANQLLVRLKLTGTPPAPLLQPLWRALVARWPWLLGHPTFGGVVGAVAFFVACCGFSVLDLTRSASTKIQKDAPWPTLREMAAAGERAI